MNIIKTNKSSFFKFIYHLSCVLRADIEVWMSILEYIRFSKAECFCCIYNDNMNALLYDINICYRENKQQQLHLIFSNRFMASNEELREKFQLYFYQRYSMTKQVHNAQKGWKLSGFWIGKIFINSSEIWHYGNLIKYQQSWYAIRKWWW